MTFLNGLTGFDCRARLFPSGPIYCAEVCFTYVTYYVLRAMVKVKRDFDSRQITNRRRRSRGVCSPTDGSHLANNQPINQ